MLKPLLAHGRRVLMDLDPDDLVSSRILRSGDYYERPLLEDARFRTPPGLVVDVGAHIGNHTLWFAAVMRRQVVALEPYEPSWQALCGHVGANGLWDRVSVHRAAAGAELMPCTVGAPKRGNTGTACARPDPRGDVQMVPLDGLELRDVALLKVDVEGLGLDVLRGAAKLLARDRPLIYIEAATDTELAGIDAHLTERGYRRFGRFCSTPTYGYEDT